MLCGSFGFLPQCAKTTIAVCRFCKLPLVRLVLILVKMNRNKITFDFIAAYRVNSLAALLAQ